MSKIVCDICGTTYPDTEEQCPICGCAKDVTVSELADELLEQEVSSAAPTAVFPGRKKKAPVYDEYDDDEYDDDDDDDDDEYDDDDDDDDDEHKSNAPLVVALVIVILLLIALGAFILVRYYLPNVTGPETTAPPAVQTTEAPVETTELLIPCESLVMTSDREIVLEFEGANWLINVMALPENTTDKLIFESSDEAVVTVNEQGKLTAVGEGTAVVTITCGQETMKCTVTCSFAEETTAPTEPEETTAPTEVTEPEETTAPTEATEPLKNITLKVIKWTDLTFNAPNQGFTFELEGLKNTEVKWTSMDENVVTVDANGTVISVGKGNTTIICQYGEQKVEIKITCRW